MIYGDIFTHYLSKEYVKEKYPQSKAKISLILSHNLETARASMYVSIIHWQEMAHATLRGHLSNSWALGRSYFLSWDGHACVYDALEKSDTAEFSGNKCKK